MFLNGIVFDDGNLILHSKSDDLVNLLNGLSKSYKGHFLWAGVVVAFGDGIKYCNNSKNNKHQLIPQFLTEINSVYVVSTRAIDDSSLKLDFDILINDDGLIDMDCLAGVDNELIDILDSVLSFKFSFRDLSDVNAFDAVKLLYFERIKIYKEVVGQFQSIGFKPPDPDEFSIHSLKNILTDLRKKTSNSD